MVLLDCCIIEVNKKPIDFITGFFLEIRGIYKNVATRTEAQAEAKDHKRLQLMLAKKKVANRASDAISVTITMLHFQSYLFQVYNRLSKGNTHVERRNFQIFVAITYIICMLHK